MAKIYTSDRFVGNLYSQDGFQKNFSNPTTVHFNGQGLTFNDLINRINSSNNNNFIVYLDSGVYNFTSITINKNVKFIGNNSVLNSTISSGVAVTINRQVEFVGVNILNTTNGYGTDDGDILVDCNNNCKFVNCELYGGRTLVRAYGYEKEIGLINCKLQNALNCVYLYGTNEDERFTNTLIMKECDIYNVVTILKAYRCTVTGMIKGCYIFEGTNMLDVTDGMYYNFNIIGNVSTSRLSTIGNTDLLGYNFVGTNGNIGFKYNKVYGIYMTRGTGGLLGTNTYSVGWSKYLIPVGNYNFFSSGTSFSTSNRTISISRMYTTGLYKVYMYGSFYTTTSVANVTFGIVKNGNVSNGLICMGGVYMMYNNSSYSVNLQGVAELAPGDDISLYISCPTNEDIGTSCITLGVEEF